jgi:hypothetical protein
MGDFSGWVMLVALRLRMSRRPFSDWIYNIALKETLNMRSHSATLTCAALSLIVTLSCPVHASLTLFGGTDFGAGLADSRPNSTAAAAAFDAAAPHLRTITFEDVTPGSFTSRLVATGVTVALNNMDEGGGISTYNDTITGYNTTSGGGRFLRVVPIRYIGTATATFTFSSPVSGFGAYLTGVGTASGLLHVMFNDGSAQDIFVAGNTNGGVQFFGFQTGIENISSIALQLRQVTGDARDIFGVDDIRLVRQPCTPTPEPTTLGLLAAGGLVLRRRLAA